MTTRMNCKPGDLAIIVRAPGKETANIVGQIVRVTKPVFDGEWCWFYEGARVICTSRAGSLALEVIEDDLLQPIRPDARLREVTGELEAA